ncbi:hypothetical protein ES703_18427 [subsurface metagenome]
MSAEDVKKQIQFEREVKVGDKCKAYWTNCGHYYGTEVEVEAINQKSFRVRVSQPTDGYPDGHKLNIPNFLNIDRWTWNNRLAPLQVDHYQEYLEAGVMPGKEIGND